MPERFGYVIVDYNRKRYALEFDAFSDEQAKREFGSWYNLLIRPSRWETRKLGRYYLYRQSRQEASGRVFLDKPVIVMEDEEVRLSYDYFRMCDPPATDEEQAELDRDFERLDAADRARLARRGNQAA